MLTALSIRDIVLIEKLDISFENGMTVLTGETGAGETILGVDLSGPEAATLLSGLSSELSGGFRLIHGGIDDIQGQPVARFFLGIPSTAGTAAQAIAYLERRGAKVEVFGHVAGHA